MKISSVHIPEVLLIEPTVFEDERGFFCESFEQSIWNDSNLNIHWPFVGESILSAKDAVGVTFRDAECFV